MFSIGNDRSNLLSSYHKNSLPNVCSAKNVIKKTRQFSNYCDPPMIADYLNNPMFDRLHSRQRYWQAGDKTITLKPIRAKKHQTKGLPIKNACRVL
jgi:hypothetical protein